MGVNLDNILTSKGLWRLHSLSLIHIYHVGEESFKVIFSAHSVPIFALDYGDPYIDQIFDNSRLIAEQLGLMTDQYTNTWQSESDIGIPWIKPDVLEYLREQKQYPEHYIFVPISFISEHIEVLFDNDAVSYTHLATVTNNKNSVPETGIDFLSSTLMLGVVLPLGGIFFIILLGHLVVNRRK